jgi:hypothetical protein
MLISKLDSGLAPKALFKVSIIRPAKMLILSPIVLALSIFTAVVYGYLYLLFTTITEVFYEEYSFSQGSVGLTYLGIGIGNLVGVLIFAIVSDRIMKKKSISGEMKPEYRLPPMIPGAFAIPLGSKHHRSSFTSPVYVILVFLYGWTAENRVFWIVPILGTSFGEPSSSLIN